jgi:hypothetical protein
MQEFFSLQGSILEPMPTKEPLFCVRLRSVLGSPKAGGRPSFLTLFDRLVPLCVVFIDPIFCPSRPVPSLSVPNRKGSLGLSLDWPWFYPLCSLWSDSSQRWLRSQPVRFTAKQPSRHRSKGAHRLQLIPKPQADRSKTECSKKEASQVGFGVKTPILGM